MQERRQFVQTRNQPMILQEHEIQSQAETNSWAPPISIMACNAFSTCQNSWTNHLFLYDILCGSKFSGVPVWHSLTSFSNRKCLATIQSNVNCVKSAGLNLFCKVFWVAVLEGYGRNMQQ
jgi:hypothetical protein